MSSTRLLRLSVHAFMNASFLVALTSLLTVTNFVKAGGPVTLTLDTFDDLRAGKNAFVKFHASWCGHCKAMKADWDKLGDEYESSSSVLIGDVECTETDEGKEMCEKFGVSGYPTIKYFVDGDTTGKDYSGGRDLDTLKTFTQETLEVKCNVHEPTECTDKEKDYIEKMKVVSSEDRKKQIKRLSGMLSGSMKKELKQWVSQRLNILKGLEGDAGSAIGTEEL